MRKFLPHAFVSLCLAAAPYCHAEVDDSADIRAAIEHSTAFGKITLEDRSQPVLKYGARAVPGLIERFNQGEKSDTVLQHTGLIHILCCIPAPEAKAFLKKVLEDRTDSRAMDAVFQYYPSDDFEEILPLAIEAEARLTGRCTFAAERAAQAVRRNPKLAGVLVGAFKDPPEPGYSNFRVGEILRMVTGIIGGFRAGEEAAFWRKWGSQPRQNRLRMAGGKL